MNHEEQNTEHTNEERKFSSRRQADITTLQTAFELYFPDVKEGLQRLHANTWLNTLPLAEVLCHMEIIADEHQQRRRYRHPSWECWKSIRATAESRVAA
jgi:hypothetical protein